MRFFIPFFVLTSLLSAQYSIRVPVTPSLSDDGSKIVFSWSGDIWLADSSGGQARRITTHPATELNPRYAPDSKTIFFNSDRQGINMQVWKVDLDHSRITSQVTHHSELTVLEDITPDGNSLILRCERDAGGMSPMRVYKQDIEANKDEVRIFDDQARTARISPDGNQLLITREAVQLYRQAYHGSQACQIWLYDCISKTFTQPVKNDYGCDSPLWMADGSGFYYINFDGGAGNLHAYTFKDGKSTPLTNYKEDGIIKADISRDGTTLIFRRLFHYYRFRPQSGEPPLKLTFTHGEDLTNLNEKDLKISTTQDVDFSPSGLEMVFEANGDLYGMDTVLREPIQLTDTPERERNIYFHDNAKLVLYIKDDGINTQLCQLSKQNPAKFWWEANKLTSKVLFQTESTLEAFAPSPDGKLIAYTTKDGKLWLCSADGKNSRIICSSWDTPSFDWSPDSKWLTYSVQDDNFNSDVFLVSIDPSAKSINISQHPDNDFAPRFSPDGKKIAFVGRRYGNDYELFFVDLTSYGSELSARAKLIDKAHEVMKNDPSYKQDTLAPEPAKKPKPNASSEESEFSDSSHGFAHSDHDDAEVLDAKKSARTTKSRTTKSSSRPTTKSKPARTAKRSDNIYDLKDVQKRIQRLTTNGMKPRNLLWTNDSEEILFQTIGKGTYRIKAKQDSEPKFITKYRGNPIRLDDSGKLFWVYRGVPSTYHDRKLTKFPFTIYCHQTREHYQRTMFRHTWRIMRDGFYDASMNGKDWNAIRTKYEEHAAHAVGSRAFDRVVAMMLGELNASHTGFKSTPWQPQWKASRPWKEAVMHLGLLFDQNHTGDGWKIKEVLPTGPGDQKRSQLYPDEIILKINGTPVKHDTYKPNVLTARPSDTVTLTVVDTSGAQRKVTMQPISYAKARKLHSLHLIDKNHAMVEKLSNGRLGYIHIASMMWDEFQKFERHLYENGAGKDGIIIDVRDNGGGFTTDHLLTALTQPRHAYTIPRNGGPGYPQDRFVYATWDKPIIVLCNQNSFSNAEIFAHAIRTLNRGKIVGVPTAGGVISTGTVHVLDAGTLRYPFRGWFDINTGKDMELNGAQPHFLIWPKPGDLAKGIDKQIEKAVEVLSDELKTSKQAFPPPIYTNRPK